MIIFPECTDSIKSCGEALGIIGLARNFRRALRPGRDVHDLKGGVGDAPETRKARIGEINRPFGRDGVEICSCFAGPNFPFAGAKDLGRKLLPALRSDVERRPCGKLEQRLGDSLGRRVAHRIRSPADIGAGAMPCAVVVTIWVWLHTAKAEPELVAPGVTVPALSRPEKGRWRPAPRLGLIVKPHSIRLYPNRREWTTYKEAVRLI